MRGTKPQPEESNPVEGPAAIQQRVVEPPVAATGSDLSRVTVRPGDFASLPNELQLAAAREVANLPNRREALEGITNLMRANKHINGLILGSKDLQESTLSLQEHPGVESRYVAVCHDVVRGMSVSSALRRNGPLPKADDLSASGVEDALEDATPAHLAKLAEAFSARTDPASKEALTGVASAVSGQDPEGLDFRLSLAGLNSLTSLAGAFCKSHVNVEDPDIKTANEAVAMQVAARGEDLLPQANLDQITTLAFAFSGHDDSDFEDPTNFNNAMVALARQVTARGDDLLPQASTEQLAALKATFEMENMEDCRTALAKVANETARRDAATLTPQNIQSRPQLDNRDRGRSVEL
jgi:hypothetical protein